MATDDKDYLKGEIGRMKEAVRNANSVLVELKHAVSEKKVKGRQSLQKELVNQQNIVDGLVAHIRHLEGLLRNIS